MAGEFAELEKTAAILAQRKERFPGGDWKLYTVYFTTFASSRIHG